MLVNKNNFKEILWKIIADAPSHIAIDTETHGIWHWISPYVEWYDPAVFSVQLYYPGASYYFDYNGGEQSLYSPSTLLNALEQELPNITWFCHNAKFEMHQLKNHGFTFKNTVHCTKQMARLYNNLEENLSLDPLSQKYLGAEKIDIKTYMKENNLFTKVKKFSVNDVTEDWLHFNKVPIEKMIEYGIKDTKLCYELGMMQLSHFEKESAEMKKMGAKKTILDCYENELKLTKICFEMESIGVLVDQEYTKEAYDSEVSAYRKIEKELDAEGSKIIPEKIDWLSTKQLKPLFAALGEPYQVTEKGNASFDKDSLEAMAHPIAAKILKYRFHYKRAHTYFENLLWLSDDKGVLHADFQPSGTQTGRMSCWNPNLQNIPKRTDKKSDDFKVRKCFIPRPGFFFADFDFQAAEYRMMIDYANETSWAKSVIDGEDVHTFTQKELSLADRDKGKTMNFAMIYGMGEKSLAYVLKTTISEARLLKNAYFKHFPKIAEFIDKVKMTAISRGFVMTFLGRVLKYDRQTSFKSPNGLIQGGVGDMTKVAMIKCHELLQGKKSKMLLQVHDAILFEIAHDEKDLIPLIKKAMCESYPHKILPMEVDGQYSRLSWGDLVDDLN